MTLGYLEEKFGFDVAEDPWPLLGLGPGGLIEFDPFSSSKSL